MSERTVYVNLECVEEAKSRAEKIGVEYKAILERYGFSSRIMSAPRGSYALTAKKMGYDPDANIGIMDKEKFENYCMAFMLDAGKWIITEPPKAKVQTQVPAPQKAEAVPNEDLLLVLEELTKGIRANTVAMTNLKEEILKERKILQDRPPADERMAKACEDVSMKLISTNRGIDAIDNKLMTLLGELQRHGGKLDGLVKHGKTNAEKISSIAQTLTGIYSKVDRMMKLYDRSLSGH